MDKQDTSASLGVSMEQLTKEYQENKLSVIDMLVRNCVAHDGLRAPIQLVDQYGCVTRPKIMSRFQKVRNFGQSASVVSYAYFQVTNFKKKFIK